MSMQMTIAQSIVAGGKTFAERRTLSGDALDAREVSLAAAKAGTLAVRTSDTVGSLTLGASHGVTTGARLDLYWTLSGVHYARRGITVGTVSGTTVPISGGSGDVLPIATTAITAMVPQEESFAVEGDDLVGLTMFTEARGQVVLAASDDSEHFARTLLSGGAYFWYTNGPDTNPIAGDSVAKVFLSHADSTAAKIIRLAALYNS